MFYEPFQEDHPLPGEKPSASPVAGADPADANTHFSDEARMERMQGAMLDVMNGVVARGRYLKYWENLRLKPIHMQMLLMKAAGYTNNKIAETIHYDPSRVSVVVNHPDAQYLLSHLVSYQAERLLDVNARIQAHAGEALDTALMLMRTGKEEVRERVSFKLLDRAGYGAVQKTEVSHRVEMAVAQADNLSAAVREAMKVEEMVEADWEVLEHPPEEGQDDEGGTSLEDLGSDASQDAGEPPTSGHLVPTQQRRTA